MTFCSQVRLSNIYHTIVFLTFFGCGVQLMGIPNQPQDFSDLVRIQETLQSPMQDFVQAIFDLVPYKRLHDHIVRDVEWKELECDLLVKKLDRTQTLFGFWGLRELSYPICHARELNRRQTIIKKLTTDYYCKKRVAQILDDIKTTDMHVVAYWNINDELNTRAQSLYYSLLGSWLAPVNRYLNRSRVALEGASIVGLAKASAMLASVLGGAGVIQEIMASIVEKRNVSLANGLLNGLAQPLRMNWPIPYVCKDGYSDDKIPEVWTKGTGGDYYAVYKDKMPGLAAGLMTAATVGVMDYSYYTNVKGLVDQCKFLYNTTRQLQERMVHVATFFKAVDRLHALVDAHVGIFGRDSKERLNFNNCSSAMKELVALLKTSTFEHSSSWLYSYGKVLLAHQLMHDTKHELIPILQMVAQIDGYYSIAQLYKEQSKDQAPFCFVDFVQSDAPYVSCERCWTPLLPTQKPVLNSFDWHKGTHIKMVLTGPNGSGKSTVMKSISHAIILAQSWGICPAHKATMRMFTGLRSSLSPREDLQQNLSTFMAEKGRIDDIKSYIVKHTPEDSYFILLDEPYRGTVESEAEYRIDLFAKELMVHNHCMMIMATHLEGPTTLQETTQGAFANYQLGLDEKSDGTFVRTFTLLPGFAQWWFKDMFKRRRFIDQLLKGQ